MTELQANDPRIKRVEAWAILNNENFPEEELFDMLEEVPSKAEEFEKYYFGCGHDEKRKKYQDWFCTDLRDIPNVHKWNTLLGHPFEDGVLNKVKSKLALGMFTYVQTKFIIRETARVLAVEGIFELTFRDFDRLLLRRRELKWRMFNRYLYGSGLYNGSQRKSGWTKKAIVNLCSNYRLQLADSVGDGMNMNLWFTRTPGTLKRFAPEPKVTYDTQGNVVNDGGDFPNA